MNRVRFGIVGVGGMGKSHAKRLSAGEIRGAELMALAGNGTGKVAAVQSLFPEVAVFGSHEKLIAAGRCDVVLIATPHFQHVPMALAAMENGLHVLCEKPLAGTLSEARRLIAAHGRYPNLLLGIVFNQRANPLYAAMRRAVLEGQIGEISRITWVVTNWFRTETYYRSSAWRATWRGEGGGVLINQCMHNLDLLPWITGMMPRRVTAVGFLGKSHAIEVEDEVSAILEYPNGAIGHLITSTGEYPGSNRLEICGSRGKLVAEEGRLVLNRTREDIRQISRTSAEGFAVPETDVSQVALDPAPRSEHQAILQDFTDAVLAGRGSESLLAPGAEGVRSLELANTMLMSMLGRRAVELPLDAAAYDGLLQSLMDKSSH